MLLAVLVVAVLALQIAWACLRIRADFARRGERVERVRWLPLRPLLERGRSRHQMLFGVRTIDRDGTAWSCVVVWTLLAGFTLEERSEVRAQPTSTRERTTSSFPRSSVACAGACCLAIGLPYWTAPYGELDLPGGLLGPGLIGLALCAGVLGTLHPRRWRSSAPILACVPLAVVLLRIAIDAARDPSTHNLFPLELALAAFVGGATVCIPLGLGVLLRRFLPGAPTSQGTTTPASARSERRRAG